MRNRNIADEMINEQIAIELNKLNSFITDEEDKPAIIQRIAELKTLLDPPSPERTESQPTARMLIADLISAIRNR